MTAIRPVWSLPSGAIVVDRESMVSLILSMEVADQEEENGKMKNIKRREKGLMLSGDMKREDYVRQ